MVLSINRQRDPSLREELLNGGVNFVVCSCGKRTGLATHMVYSDDEGEFLCQVCVGGEASMAEALGHFKTLGTTGTHRLVPSRNALVEKVKLHEAGLLDWAIEITKLLLLASRGPGEVNRVLLFERVDEKHQMLHWVLLDESGQPKPVASALEAYTRGVEQWGDFAPRETEHRIDRLWALEAWQRILRARQTMS